MGGNRNNLKKKSAMGSQTALHGKSAMMVCCCFNKKKNAAESATASRLNNDKSATGGLSMCLECHMIL